MQKIIENIEEVIVPIHITNQRGKMKGVVVNNNRYMEGTITVLVKRSFPHKKYHKIITTSKKYIVQYNDKHKEIPLGTEVILCQIAKASKRKFLRIESYKGVQ
jgi:ribosomal protein S17